MIVGLTGGIGSGKTEVAKVFSQLGALVIDTDELAREVVAPGSEGLKEIERAWPEVITNGVLDRAGLAQIVFDDASARERLNALLHPRIRKLAEERSATAAYGKIVVQVIPLLFETGLDKGMDANIVVTAPENERIARVALRDNSGHEAIHARMRAQIDPAEATRRADYVITNSGGFDELQKQASAVFYALEGFSKRTNG